MKATDVKRGDRFVHYHDGEPAIFIEVVRVARDGSTADIRCFTWACSWAKRQPLPLPDLERENWTAADVVNQETRQRANAKAKAERS